MYMDFYNKKAQNLIVRQLQIKKHSVTEEHHLLMSSKNLVPYMEIWRIGKQAL